MKKRLNSFGEGECGMLMSAWEGTEDERARNKEHQKTSGEAEGMF
jgi:hypothetical protein